MIEKINCLIVDDEERAIRAMELLLSKHCPEINIVATAENIDDAYRKIIEWSPQILFLDINMSGGSGIDLLERMDGIDTQVIFTTAHQEHAITALRLSAFDYLLKPIDPEEVKNAVKRYRGQQKFRDYGLIKSIVQEEQLTRIIVNSQEGVQVVEIDEIDYVSADRNYCVFHLNGSSVTVSKPLVEYEKLLSAVHFLRIHKSYLVNLKKIKEYKKGKEPRIILKNGEQLELSRNRKDDLVLALNNL